MLNFIKSIVIPSIVGGLIGVSIASLTSCNQQPSPAADGYTFGKKEYEMNNVQIEIVAHKTQKEMIKALNERNVKNPEEIAAFSVLRPPYDKCTIHIIDPNVEYAPEFVGHEFLHCVYGQWHTNNDSRS